MRTNIDIDDELLTEATRLSGLPTKKAVVEEALRRLVQGARQAEALKELWGIGWEGDLDKMRTDLDLPHHDEPHHDEDDDRR